MILLRHVCGLLETNTSLICCEDTKKAAVIDPGFKSFPWIQKQIEAQGCELVAILLTHGHFDHIMDVSIVKEHFPNVQVYVHSKDRESLVHPDSTFYLKPKAVIPDVLLEGKETIYVGKIEIQVIYTPGHTEGSVCYYVPQEKLLFSGDTLFRGTIGRIHAAESLMWDSLLKLSHLPPGTRVIPGHSKDTTIGEEPFLSNPKKFFS